jgi:hypothetical protein
MAVEPWMDGWIDGWMEGWMDGWMDEWMDRYNEENARLLNEAPVVGLSSLSNQPERIYVIVATGACNYAYSLIIQRY